MRSGATLAMLVLALAPAGCAVRRAPPNLADPARAAAAYAALLPTSVRIHPLTRIGPDPDPRSGGVPALILHAELRDRFDQETRALGVFRIVARDEGRRADWEVDVRDPQTNARFFDDLVTRTYVLTLTGLPDWLTMRERPEIDLEFTFHDGTGVRTLHDSAELRP